MADDPLIHDPEGGMDRLAMIMARLRSPEGGCPWDLEQDFDTIAPYTIEEAYEVADAIARRDWDALKGELGDLMFQSVYHAQMAAEAGLFTLDDVLRGIADKMVARHPHVFGDETIATAAAQTDAWEARKARERAARAQTGVLDDVPVGHPGLTRAVKLQNRAARVGFDWPEVSQVVDKIAEEARELMAELGFRTVIDVVDLLEPATDPRRAGDRVPVELDVGHDHDLVDQVRHGGRAVFLPSEEGQG